MKKLIAIMAVLLLASCAGMKPMDMDMAEMTAADQKLSALTALEAAPASTDYMYIVNDEATDVSQSITVSYLFSYLNGNNFTSLTGNWTTTGDIVGDTVSDGTVTLAGDGTITGVSVGGLPDNIVDNGMMADDAVDSADIADGAVDNVHLSNDAALSAVISGDPDSLDDTLSTNPKLYRGGFIRYTAAGEATLDAFSTAGESVAILFYPSVAIIVNPNAAQTITLNGTAIAQGEALINDSNYGLCVLTYLGTNSIDAQCSGDIAQETP